DLVELVHAIEPTHVLAVAPRLAAKTRRVGTASNGQRGFLEDLVAEKIRERHLGRRHREQPVGRRFIHLPFLVGKLASGGCACGRGSSCAPCNENTTFCSGVRPSGTEACGRFGIESIAWRNCSSSSLRRASRSLTCAETVFISATLAVNSGLPFGNAAIAVLA